MLQELQTVPLPFLKALHISHGWAHILINSVPRSKADTADHAPDFVWSARTQETPNDHFLPLRMDWHHLLAAWSHDWWEFTRTISWCVFFYFCSARNKQNERRGDERRTGRWFVGFTQRQWHICKEFLRIIPLSAEVEQVTPLRIEEGKEESDCPRLTASQRCQQLLMSFLSPSCFDLHLTTMRQK